MHQSVGLKLSQPLITSHENMATPFSVLPHFQDRVWCGNLLQGCTRVSKPWVWDKGEQRKGFFLPRVAPTGRVKPSPHFCLLCLPFRQENARICNQTRPQPAVSAAGSSHCSASVPTKCEVLSCKLFLSNKLLMKLLPDRLQSQGALGNSAPPPKCSNTCIYLKNICLLFPMTLQLFELLSTSGTQMLWLPADRRITFPSSTLNFS